MSLKVHFCTSLIIADMIVYALRMRMHVIIQFGLPWFTVTGMRCPVILNVLSGNPMHGKYWKTEKHWTGTQNKNHNNSAEWTNLLFVRFVSYYKAIRYYLRNKNHADCHLSSWTVNTTSHTLNWEGAKTGTVLVASAVVEAATGVEAVGSVFPNERIQAISCFLGPIGKPSSRKSASSRRRILLRLISCSVGNSSNRCNRIVKKW